MIDNNMKKKGGEELTEKLKESEDKYKIVADNTYDWEYWMGPDKEFLYSSPSCKRITGYSREEFLKDDPLLYRIIFPEDRKIFLDHEKKVYSNKKPAEVNFRIIRKDGKIGHINHWCQPVFDSKGKYLGIRASNRDVTQLRMSEEKLKESENKYKVIFDSTNDSIFIHSLDGKILEVNDTACKKLGYTKKELLQLSPTKVDSPKFAKNVPLRIKEVFKEGSSIFETAHITKSGKEIPVEVNARLINFDSSKAIISICRDISKKKKADEELKESEEKYKLISENSKATMMLTLPDKTISYLSPSSIDVFGWPAEDLVGKSKDIFHPEDRKTIFEHLSMVLKGKSFKNFRYRVIGKDKKVYWISHSANPVFENGKLKQVVSVIINVDEIIKAELEVEEYSERLKIATRAAHIGIWDWDIVKDNLIWDDNISVMYGISPGGFKGGAGEWSKWIIEEDRLRVWKELQASINGKGEYCPEFRIRMSKTGEIRHIQANSQTFFDKNGKAIRMVGTNIDITDRKKAEEQIKESGDKFRSIFEFSPISMYLYELDSKNNLIFMGANPSADKTIGIDHSKFLGKTLEQAFPGLKNTKIPKAYLNVALTGKSWHDSSIEYSSGEISGAYDVFVFRNSPNRIVVAFTDITERKKLEEELTRSNNFANALLSSIPLPTFYKDSKGRYMGCNQEFTKVMGVTAEQIKGKTVMELWPSEHAKMYHEKDLELMKNPVKQIYEYKIKDKNGVERPVIYSKNVFYNKDGSIAGIIGCFLDISERKKIQEELEKVKLEKVQAEEAEKFNKFAINRELKMVELKKKIAKLEAELKEK
jgi:PAS domain S-box-containing protein